MTKPKKYVSLKIEDTLRDELKALAASKGMTIVGLLRMVIKNGK